MQRFRSVSFASAIAVVSRAQTMLDVAASAGWQENDEVDRKLVQDALDEARSSFDELPLSRVVSSQYQRILERVATSTAKELKILLEELANNMFVDLSGHYFLMIEGGFRRGLYEQAQRPFSDATYSAFSDAQKDLDASARCLALDEWTACVFHLMRALESALRRVGAVVGLDGAALEQENWKNLIDQIEKRIRSIQEERKSAEKVERLKTLSELAVQFRYFKDAWRNHVSHARVSYDEREAVQIWSHVKTFIEDAATISEGTA
jgi:hypothetical protein